MMKITRKTDSLLDLVGNCGGFMEALKIVGRLLAFAFSAYELKVTLAQNLVRFVPSKSQDCEKNDKDKLIQRQE